MNGTTQEVLSYLQASPILSVGIALVAGFAAAKTVAHGARNSVLLVLLIGLVGFFVGEFAIRYFGFKETLEKLPEFRIFFDLIAAYVGSFGVAAVVHFTKPL